MKSAQEIENGLAHCYGSEKWHRWSPIFPKHTMTDGVKFLCDNADCYWLVDAIASHTHEHQHEEFQVWTLKVEDSKAVLTGDDGNGNVFVTQEIEYTDFPLKEITLYCNLGSLDGVHMEWIVILPSEN